MEAKKQSRGEIQIVEIDFFFLGGGDILNVNLEVKTTKMKNTHKNSVKKA